MPEKENRTPERLKAHYLIEKELADRLRRADKAARQGLYAQVYAELRRLVSDHPDWWPWANTAARAWSLRNQMALLKRFLRPGTVLLEVGAGDCRLAIEAAKRVAQVYAVDVSSPERCGAPPNFQFIQAPVGRIGLPPGSVDLVYSHQFLEHLHPEDAVDHLRRVCALLRPGGRYVCLTPNRLSGPHDVSRYFDDTATGLHLMEYTCGELAELFRQAGFSKVQLYAGAKGLFCRWPLGCVVLVEKLLAALPAPARKALARRLLRPVLGIRMVAAK